jgi:hypothetical protein
MRKTAGFQEATTIHVSVKPQKHSLVLKMVANTQGVRLLGMTAKGSWL